MNTEELLSKDKIIELQKAYNTLLIVLPEIVNELMFKLTEENCTSENYKELGEFLKETRPFLERYNLLLHTLIFNNKF